jgi:hypothetical protein
LTALTVNGHTFTSGSSTFTGTAGQTYTFPSTTASLARSEAAQTFTGTQTFGTDVVLTSATAGARLTGGNGTVTIKGEGDGQDESLTLDFNTTANKVTVSSATGVTELNTSAINLVSTGYVDAGVRVYTSTDAAVTVSGMSAVYFNSDDDVITFNLPADPVNKAFCFGNTVYARAITVNPDDADYIVNDGVTAAAGEALVSSGNAKDWVCVVGITASYWRVTGSIGTWAQETP